MFEGVSACLVFVAVADADADFDSGLGRESLALSCRYPYQRASVCLEKTM